MLLFWICARRAEIAMGGENLGYSNCTFNQAPPSIFEGFNMQPPLSDDFDGPYYSDLTLTDPTPF